MEKKTLHRIFFDSYICPIKIEVIYKLCCKHIQITLIIPKHSNCSSSKRLHHVPDCGSRQS